MAFEVSGRDLDRASGRDAAFRSGSHAIRTFFAAAGLCWAVAFVLVGLRYDLAMYADGSIFSYLVAAQDAWAFHWHNISGRLFVYLFSVMPAEMYVGLTDDARGGIELYALLFFSAPLLGLIATFAADRSNGRIIFNYACVSTACLCPLVFGFPTEMWVAHALFWPTLALCHYAGAGRAGWLAVAAAMLALTFTHEGALILDAELVGTLALRGIRDPAFRRGASVLLVVFALWVVVKLTLRPDAYIADVLDAAALHFFDPERLANHLVLLLVTVLAAYALLVAALSRVAIANAHVIGAAIVALALAAFYLLFDASLHADYRYYSRTVLLLGTLALGGAAAVYALRADGRLIDLPSVAQRLVHRLADARSLKAAFGAILLVMLVHAVETAKFAQAWVTYQAAVRALASGTAADAALGSPRFVSADRIGAKLRRLAWNSTTPFLSVLVAPKFLPSRLVISPRANYFWLSCATATENSRADAALPAESRGLIRLHACLHR